MDAAGVELAAAEMVGARPACAVDETVILLRPPLPLVGVSIGTERGCQRNDSLADGYLPPAGRPQLVEEEARLAFSAKFELLFIMLSSASTSSRFRCSAAAEHVLAYSCGRDSPQGLQL